MTMFAHGSHGSGITAGITHPIFGLDHLLAIMALGLLIAKMGAKSSWLIPLTFCASMGISGWLGIGTDGFPYMESGIALSVVLLGLALALQVTLPVGIGLVASVVIAFFHGYAHGVEIPESTSPLLYITGFLIGVLLIFLLSITLGRYIVKANSKIPILRVAGAIIAGLGLMVLIG